MLQKIIFYVFTQILKTKVIVFLKKSLLKNGLGLASYLHDRVVLHGNVFSIGGKAYAVIAPSGSGKSSLTAGMIRYGQASLLSEDSVYINSDGFTTYSGSQELYLFPDAALGIVGKCGKNNDSGKQSFLYPISEPNEGIYQLAGIFILRDESDVELIKYCKIKSLHALRLITNNLRYRKIIGQNIIADSIGILAKTLSLIPVYAVSLKKEYRLLEEQIQVLHKLIVGGL